MYHQTAGLIVFRDFGEDSILGNLAKICFDLEAGHGADELTDRLYAEVKRLLDLSTAYGFDSNLWQDYLTFLLLTNENSFTLTAENRGVTEGSIVRFVLHDL